MKLRPVAASFDFFSQKEHGDVHKLCLEARGRTEYCIRVLGAIYAREYEVYTGEKKVVRSPPNLHLMALRRRRAFTLHSVQYSWRRVLGIDCSSQGPTVSPVNTAGNKIARARPTSLCTNLYPLFTVCRAADFGVLRRSPPPSQYHYSLRDAFSFVQLFLFAVSLRTRISFSFFKHTNTFPLPLVHVFLIERNIKFRLRHAFFSFFFFFLLYLYLRSLFAILIERRISKIFLFSVRSYACGFSGDGNRICSFSEIKKLSFSY